MRRVPGGLGVPAQINGRFGYMIVDTGFPHTMLNQLAISGLDMRVVNMPHPYLMTDAAGYGAFANKTRFATLKIGNFSVPPQSLAAIKLPSQKRAGPDGMFFGYLGHDLLACYVGIIDCAALKLFLRFDPVIDAARRKRSD
jgi:hypothetical protein